MCYMCNDNWNIDHRRWSEICLLTRGDHIKKKKKKRYHPQTRSPTYRKSKSQFQSCFTSHHTTQKNQHLFYPIYFFKILMQHWVRRYADSEQTKCLWLKRGRESISILLSKECLILGQIFKIYEKTIKSFSQSRSVLIKYNYFQWVWAHYSNRV